MLYSMNCASRARQEGFLFGSVRSHHVKNITDSQSSGTREEKRMCKWINPRPLFVVHRLTRNHFFLPLCENEIIECAYTVSCVHIIKPWTCLVSSYIWYSNIGFTYSDRARAGTGPSVVCLSIYYQTIDTIPIYCHAESHIRVPGNRNNLTDCSLTLCMLNSA